MQSRTKLVVIGGGIAGWTPVASPVTPMSLTVIEDYQNEFGFLYPGEDPRRKLTTLKIDATHAPAQGGASLMKNDTVVGTVTSGDWGHRVGMNLAYAFVDSILANDGSAMELDLCGDLVAAEVIAPSPYDPDFDRMRGQRLLTRD